MSNTLEITLFEKEKIDIYAEFAQKAFEGNEHFQKIAKTEFGEMFNKNALHPPLFWVATKDSEIVGIIGVIKEWFSAKTYAVFYLCVDKKYRSQGIGKALLKHAIEYVQVDCLSGENGQIILASKHKNYYERLGFDRLGELSEGQNAIFRYLIED